VTAPRCQQSPFSARAKIGCLLNCASCFLLKQHFHLLGENHAGNHVLARSGRPNCGPTHQGGNLRGAHEEVWNDAQVARGQLSYADAKADFDAVIAGLIAALSAGQAPASLPSLQAKLTSGVSALLEFSNMVSKLLPDTPGKKGIMDELAKIIPIEPLLKMLSEGVSALYSNHRNDDALTRRTIQTQLEAARWPTFSEVKAAQ
jgi:hypothetical protein